MQFDPFVKAAQKKLRSKGFYTGDVDGLAGDQTVAAIKAFEKSIGQPEDGTLDKKTWDLLDDAGERADEIAEFRNPATPPPQDNPSESRAWPRQKDCDTFYGRPRLDGKGGGTAVNQVMLQLPWPMRIAWDLGKSITRMQCHEKVHDSLFAIFDKVGKAYNEAQRREIGLDLFGGSTNVRAMRGGTALSMHSYGIAVDIDPIRNQLKWGKDRARLAQPDAEEFWRIVESEGAISLGRLRNFDWMHMQFARL